ncbi:hypothetical protein KY289_035637 [Solanum tuberosum]|nr:hypothetical protein KY289_035637 [Solanum tuberosum]
MKKHNPTNESSTKHHHPINGSTSSCQWINIILPMDHQRSIIILSMDQHHPTNGSSTKHHYPNGSTSSFQWINIILLMDHQRSIIVLSMDQHHPVNGPTSSNRWIINEASSSYQWRINFIPLIDHQTLSYQWSIDVIIMSCSSVILPMDHYHPINKASLSTSYQIIIYCIKTDGS